MRHLGPGRMALVVAATAAAAPPSAAGGSLPVAIRSDTHLFTIGFDYRFNWSGGGALAARY